MRETQTGDCPSFRGKQEHITEEEEEKQEREIRFTGPQTHESLKCVSESCQMWWKQPPPPLPSPSPPPSAQCHKSLAWGDLRGKTYETCIPDSLPNWLLIQTDVVFSLLSLFSPPFLMKCNWRAARLHSKLKRERDSLRARPTWFERAYLSLAPVILTSQIA